MKSLSALIGELIAIKDRLARSTESYEAARKDFRVKVTLLEGEISDDLEIERTADGFQSQHLGNRR